MGFPSVYGGVLPLMVMNTAVSLALVRNLVDALLRIVGLKRDQEERQQEQRIPEPNFYYPHEISETSRSSSSSFVEEIQATLPLIEFRQLAAEGFELGEDHRSEQEQEQPQCAVCLSEFEDSHLVRKLPRCSHVFHGNCLDKWLAHNQTSCPMCRASLLTDDLARVHKQREEVLAEELALWLSVYHTSALSRGPWWYRGHGSGLAGGWDFH